MRYRVAPVLTLGLWLALAHVSAPASAQSAQTATAGKPEATAELDAFMAQVLARRDENWKKVQQYILEERERAELRGPFDILLWGAEREYIWYPREGFFVRSPVRFNGVDISEPERERTNRSFCSERRPATTARRNEAKKPTAPLTFLRRPTCRASCSRRASRSSSRQRIS